MNYLKKLLNVINFIGSLKRKKENYNFIENSEENTETNDLVMSVVNQGCFSIIK